MRAMTEPGAEPARQTGKKIGTSSPS